jgi:hypothetical protein
MKPIKKIYVILFFCLIGISSPGTAQEKNISSQVIHIVLFKFSDQAHQDQIDQLMDHIKGLKNQITGIQAMTFGQNFSERSKGYTNAVTIAFASKTALQNFMIHPLHQQLIKDFIKPILADMIVVDYTDNTNL